MADATALLDLYDREFAAFTAYVKYQRGDSLVGGQQVRPTELERLRNEWLALRRELDAVSSPAALAVALTGRVHETDVKRGS